MSEPTTLSRSVTLEGQPFRYVFDRYERPRSELPVVCLHGITRNRHDFGYFARRLSTRRSAYVPDLFGHGDSEWFDGRLVYEKELFLEQLRDLIDAVQSPVGFVGSSYGGLMGVRLAARGDVPIAALVLNDSGVGIDRSFYRDIAKKISVYPRFGSMRSVRSWMRLVTQPGGELSPDMIESLARTSVRRLDDGDFCLAYDKELPRVWLDNDDRRPESWDMWEAITCPVLVVRGVRSEVITADVLAEMKRRKPSIDVLELEDVGHYPNLMTEPQIEPILAWLDERLVGAPQKTP